ncbi:hypothetical protein [Rhodopirellula bahusiensis]|uniref:hypothetical protein n=1 Tax=Rhodopirellula bahusiensis TaxID=2014065 RepID=UPI003267D3F8
MKRFWIAFLGWKDRFCVPLTWTNFCRGAALLAALSVVLPIASYYHGVPFIQYRFEAEDRYGWLPPAARKNSATYISLVGRIDAEANLYGGPGCPWVIFIPVEHIDGLDQKLPFSIIYRVDRFFSGPNDTPTNEVL